MFDVRNGDAVASFVARVGERYGQIDAVVNNAGGTFAAGFLDVSASAEAALIAENVTQVTVFVRGPPR